jgi:hypothetical protein
MRYSWLAQATLNIEFPENVDRTLQKSRDEMNPAGVKRGFEEKPGRDNRASRMEVDSSSATISRYRSVDFVIGIRGTLF